MTGSVSRRSAVLSVLPMGCVLLAACMPQPEPRPTPPEEPRPTPPEEPPPLPALASLAARVGVEAADAGMRQVVLRTASGGLLNLTLPAGAAIPRHGAQALLEYDDRGAARLLPAPQRPGAVPRGRVAVTIREVELGGRHMTLVDTGGIEQSFELTHPAMMAFATRLAPGEAVAVTIAGR